MFARGFYRFSLLGKFIGLMRWMSWAYRLDTTKILHARTMEEQRAIFERDWARVFKSWFVRWVANRPGCWMCSARIKIKMARSG